MNPFVRLVQRNLPTILTVIAGTGYASAVVLGVKATPKAVALCDDAMWVSYLDATEDLIQCGKETPETIPSFAEWMGWSDDIPAANIRLKELGAVNTMRICWKVYIPTAVVFAASTAALIGAHSIHLKRQAATASLLALTTETMKIYQRKVIDKIGEKPERELRDSVIAERLPPRPTSQQKVPKVGMGSALFCETITGRYFYSDPETVKKIINEHNSNLIHSGQLTYNDYCWEFGLHPIRDGDNKGWDHDYDGKLIDYDLSAQVSEEGELCFAIDYRVVPVPLPRH